LLNRGARGFESHLLRVVTSAEDSGGRHRPSPAAPRPAGARTTAQLALLCNLLRVRRGPRPPLPGRDRDRRQRPGLRPGPAPRRSPGAAPGPFCTSVSSFPVPTPSVSCSPGWKPTVCRSWSAGTSQAMSRSSALTRTAGEWRSTGNRSASPVPLGRTCSAALIRRQRCRQSHRQARAMPNRWGAGGLLASLSAPQSRTVVFRSRGIRGTSRLRDCVAAASDACRCDTGRAWPWWPPWG
jgi:hypothetical protein